MSKGEKAFVTAIATLAVVFLATVVAYWCSKLIGKM